MDRYYFLAVPIPEHIRLSLKQEADLLKDKWAYRKWTGCGDYHITLHFFGGLDPEQLEKVRLLSAETAAKHRPFHLTLSGPGGFGSKGHPRVIFFGTEPSASLIRLNCYLLCCLYESGFRT
jgi:2'-5' RNA ligase